MQVVKLTFSAVYATRRKRAPLKCYLRITKNERNRCPFKLETSTEGGATNGRKSKFETAEELWSACLRYFNWVEANLFFEQRCFVCRGELVKPQISKMRAMTVTGLCIHLGMTFETWTQYRKKPDFSEVTKYVEEFIRTQKFEGAAAGLFNANIIAREIAREIAFALAKGFRSPA